MMNFIIIGKINLYLSKLGYIKKKITRIERKKIDSTIKSHGQNR